MRGKGIGYARVSTNEQARHGISLEMQVDRIRAYAASQGIELVDVIVEEGISASRHMRNRPGGIELIDRIEREKIEHVIIWRLDRAFRNTIDALSQTEAWDKSGVAMHVVDVGGAAIDTKGAMGRFVFQILVGLAEMERNVTAERTASVLKHKKDAGKVYNHAPFGQNRVGDDLIPNEQEQAILREMRKLKDQGQSLRYIARYLTEKGIPTKNGGVWHPQTVKNMLENNRELVEA